MSELFREIEEDIRQERFDRAWRHVGKLMLGVSIALVAGTAAVVGVQNYRQSKAMETTSVFIHGMDRAGAGDYKAAAGAFAGLARDAGSPYYGLAMLRKAEAENEAGDKDEAAKTYATLAAQDSVFGSLARMQAGKVPPEPPRSSPLYYTQNEWLGWQLLKEGKKDEAVKRFLALRDDAGAPYSLRERMNETLEHIAPDAGAANDEKKK